MFLVIASNIVPPEGIIISVRLMNPLEDINPFFDSLTTPISSPRSGLWLILCKRNDSPR